MRISDWSSDVCSSDLKLRLQTRQPLRVGARLVGKQLSARAQGGFVAIAMLGVPRVEREDEPVEEAPPVPRRLDEQPIHRRGQQQYRQSSDENTSELQSLIGTSYDVLCLQQQDNT